MRKIAIMLTACTAIATSYSLTPPKVWAAEGDGPSTVSTTITTTDEHGRKIYTNDSAPAQSHAAPARAAQTRNAGVLEQQRKSVETGARRGTASMQAARSAAAEVSGYFAHESVRSANAKIIAANAHGHQATPDEVDASIVMAAARHNVDPNLVRAVVKVESNFNSNAVSRKGAMGLMQLMPSTARSLNVKNPFDPAQNVDAGVRHLKQLLENYGGDVNLTLAAYNAGSGAVARSSGIPRFAETQNYVRRITNLYYGGFDLGPSGPSRDPVKVQRDARGVLYISNTD